MKRFFKVFALLLVSLFLLVSGVDSALDHLSRSVTQNSFTYYNAKGDVLVAYNGDLNLCRPYLKPGPVSVPIFLHRTRASASSSFSPVSSSYSSSWL